MITIYQYLKGEGLIKQSHPDTFISRSFDQTTSYNLVEKETFSYNHKNRNYTGLVIRPLTMKKQALPVLYLLHGLGGNAEWTQRGCILNILNHMLEQNAIKRPFMVVLPNIFQNSYESDRQKLMDYKAITELFRENSGFSTFITTQFYGLEGKYATALAGLSMGGLCALYTVTKLNNLFGSVGAFSPSGGLVSPSKTWLSSYNEFTHAMDNDIFVFISKGTEDGVVNNQPIVYHNQLTDNNISNTLALYPGGHDWEAFKKGLYLYLLNDIFPY